MKTFPSKALLKCGIVAPLLYILTDFLLGLSWPAYNFNSQSISELSAIGAPTRIPWVSMTFLFNPLIIAFGIGVYQAAKYLRLLRAAGIMLILWGISGFLWLFSPMHLRGNIGSTTDTLHLVMAAFTVLTITAYIGIGAFTQGRWFRFYSIFTLITMLIFGFWVARLAPLVAANMPTPWMGILERVSVYSSMLWVSVLAVTLIRKNHGHNDK
jgi:hypothetical protein